MKMILLSTTKLNFIALLEDLVTSKKEFMNVPGNILNFIKNLT